LHDTNLNTSKYKTDPAGIMKQKQKTLAILHNTYYLFTGDRDEHPGVQDHLPECADHYHANQHTVSKANQRSLLTWTK
jgi:hypothetical protein